MPADQYLTLKNGRDTLIPATQVSTGSNEGGDLVALGDNGYLDLSLMPPEVLKNNVKRFNTTEALAPGKYVNIFSPSAGVFNVRLADATNDRPAHGFVKTTYAANALAEVYFEGTNTGLSGLAAGRVYLAAAGGITQTPPTKATYAISQYLGTAISATEVDTDIADETVL
jgi:hypothetical protein